MSWNLLLAMLSLIGMKTSDAAKKPKNENLPLIKPCVGNPMDHAEYNAQYWKPNGTRTCSCTKTGVSIIRLTIHLEIRTEEFETIYTSRDWYEMTRRYLQTIYGPPIDLNKFNRFNDYAYEEDSGEDLRTLQRWEVFRFDMEWYTKDLARDVEMEWFTDRVSFVDGFFDWLYALPDKDDLFEEILKEEKTRIRKGTKETTVLNYQEIDDLVDCRYIECSEYTHCIKMETNILCMSDCDHPGGLKCPDGFRCHQPHYMARARCRRHGDHSEDRLRVDNVLTTGDLAIYVVIFVSYLLLLLASNEINRARRRKMGVKKAYEMMEDGGPKFTEWETRYTEVIYNF